MAEPSWNDPLQSASVRKPTWQVCRQPGKYHRPTSPEKSASGKFPWKDPFCLSAGGYLLDDGVLVHYFSDPGFGVELRRGKKNWKEVAPDSDLRFQDQFRGPFGLS